MDIGYTYASQQGERASIYAPPGLKPANSLELERDGRPVVFLRLSDVELTCEPVPALKGKDKGAGPCRSYECHRAELGECQCGRHGRVTVRRAR